MNRGQGAGREGRGKERDAPSPALRPSSHRLRQRMLIIGPSNIGDAILMSPIVAALSRRHPQAHVTLVVGERAKALFVDDPRIHALVDTSRFDSPLGRLRLLAALWRYRPHVVVDVRHTLYPLLLKPLQAWRYARRPPGRLAHMRERHLWSFRAQAPGVARGVTGAEGAPFVFTAKDIAQIDALQRRWGLEGARRLVVICPGARSHIKRWVTEGFARVADELIERCGAEVVLSGEPDEEPVIAEILKAMRRRAHSAVGLATIRQVALLMQRAELVITNDSASLHLASAVGVPTVALFGPTDARKYGPTAPRHRTIRRRLFCAPCEQALCAFNHECMRFVSADEVLRAATELLRQGTSPNMPSPGA